MSEERDDIEFEEEPQKQTKARRGEDILGRKDSPIRKELRKTWESIRKGFEDQNKRADCQEDYWKAYNCIYNGDQQYYNGEAEIVMPITSDAITAITTRVSNQLYPEGGHYIDVVGDEASRPWAIVAMLDHYLQQAEAKNQVCKPLLRHGLIEGQYNLYVDWMEIDREIVSRETRSPTMEVAGEEIELPGEEIEDVKVSIIREARPAIEVLHDSDVLVLPANADSIDEALQSGGSVTIVRRWSKGKIERLRDAGILNKGEANDLIDLMEAQAKQDPGAPHDIEKSLSEMVGIYSRGSQAMIWETWKMLPLNEDGRYKEKGDTRRICQMFFAVSNMCVGCRRNPNWSDRINLISKPVEKVGGAFKGKSQVEKVITLQYSATDAANEGDDMSHMSACGLVIRDPTISKMPLVMAPGAVWDAPPDSIKFAEFPDLTPRALARIQAMTSQVFQTMGVNPSMIPYLTSTGKRNQAQVAQEQQVDLLTTTESASVLVDVFSEVAALMVDLDYQYREDEISALVYGEVGVKATMEKIPPQLNRTAYHFKWVGVERARNAQTNQQKMGFLNVARGMAEVLAGEGKRLTLSSALEMAAVDLWGPHDGPKIVEDVRSQMSMDPQEENQLIEMGHEVPVHILDDDQKHMPVHSQGEQMAMAAGDQALVMRYKIHNQMHLLQSNKKQQAQMQQQMQQQAQGGPPGRGGGPPRQGAVPGGPHLIKGPPGQIHPDQMPRAGAVPMPRRM